MQASDSGSRDALLRRIMLSEVDDEEGTKSFWETRLRDLPVDERWPPWVEFGPYGQAVMALSEGIGVWPFGACAVAGGCEMPRVKDPARYRTATTRAEELVGEEAVELAQQLAVSTLGGLELPGMLGRVENGSTMMIYLHLRLGYGACTEVLTGDSGLVQSREAALLLRLGHIPAGEQAPSSCLLCGVVTGPASGVVELPDGSLEWVDDDGELVTVPVVRWMPSSWSSPSRRETMAAPECR
jgi:hypothetical protein